MNRYYLSAIAEQDIEDIVSYISKRNPAAAIKLLDTLYGAMDMLADNYKLGHKREDLTDRPVRFWPFKWRYLIIYTDSNPIAAVPAEKMNNSNENNELQKKDYENDLNNNNNNQSLNTPAGITDPIEIVRVLSRYRDIENLLD